MIAMGITSIYDECRRDAVASAPGYPAPAPGSTPLLSVAVDEVAPSIG